MPVSAAGWRIDPPVSVAVAAGAKRAATAAAEPPELPPGTASASQGLRTGPYHEVSLDEPMANSSMFVLPSVTAPASFRRPTTCASYGATKFESILEPQEETQPLVQKMSLCAMGTPVSGPARPAARALSASRACARVSSSSSEMKQFNFGFCAR